MPAVRGRSPQAYLGGYKVGEMMRTDPEGEEQFFELAAKALGDALSELAPIHNRWSSGEFLLGMAHGYAGAKCMVGQAEPRVL